jgi:hypothetical protein
MGIWNLTLCSISIVAASPWIWDPICPAYRHFSYIDKAIVYQDGSRVFPDDSGLVTSSWIWNQDIRNYYRYRWPMADPTSNIQYARSLSGVGSKYDDNAAEEQSLDTVDVYSEECRAHGDLFHECARSSPVQSDYRSSELLRAKLFQMRNEITHSGDTLDGAPAQVCPEHFSSGPSRVFPDWRTPNSKEKVWIYEDGGPIQPDDSSEDSAHAFPSFWGLIEAVTYSEWYAHFMKLAVFLFQLLRRLPTAGDLVFFPLSYGRRPTTMPWNIWPSLAILWGVCWMFYNIPASSPVLGDLASFWTVDGYDFGFGCKCIFIPTSKYVLTCWIVNFDETFPSSGFQDPFQPGDEAPTDLFDHHSSEDAGLSLAFSASHVLAEGDPATLGVYSILGVLEEAEVGTEFDPSIAATFSSLTQSKDGGNTCLNQGDEREPSTLVCSYSECAGEVFTRKCDLK